MADATILEKYIINTRNKLIEANIERRQVESFMFARIYRYTYYEYILYNII